MLDLRNDSSSSTIRETSCETAKRLGLTAKRECMRRVRDQRRATGLCFNCGASSVDAKACNKCRVSMNAAALRCFHRQRDKRNADSRARRQAIKEAKAGRPKPMHCEACGDSHRRINYDHDHQTGEFRGWLCYHCNLAIGHAKESASRLKKLFEYLEKHVQAS